MTTIDLTLSEQTDAKGEGTGVEEEAAGTDLEKIAEPFDPDDIDVATRSMTVDLLLSRAKSGMIDLQPEFQRRWGIWDARRQSRLIESLLLRIPLPVLYAAEDDSERWEIVDGIQRLSTIARFIDSSIIGEKPLRLVDLEYLSDFNHKYVHDLPARLQLRLKESELIIHLIRKGTPAEVKFNIFARINTGGMSLSSQELRHAITPGPARKLLELYSELPSFRRATDYSVKSTRMDDRELVLRFLAFHLVGVENYRQPDMDGFLIGAMKHINSLAADQVEEAKAAFIAAMDDAYSIFGIDAFRKRYLPGASRLPINKALFEAISVSLAELTTAQRNTVRSRRSSVVQALIGLCNDRSFESAISQGTGDIGKVNRRFGMVRRMIQEAAQ